MSFSHTANGTQITPVPKLFSNTKKSALLKSADPTLMLPELRGLTLKLVDGDVISETKENPYSPSSNIKFAFFNQTDLPVTALLKAVVRGELKEAKAMLEKNPELVLYKGQVTDYSGRTIEGTAYQIALGAEDINTGKDQDGNNKNDGMAEMICGYFKRAHSNDEESANEEILKQQEAQFPGGYDNYENSNEVKEKYKNDLKAFETVFNAILNADAKEIKRIPKGIKNKYHDDEYNLEVTGECAKALQTFRDYLKPQGVIKKGKHFNAQLLVNAFEKYVKGNFGPFNDDHTSPKNLLFWRQVIGYIERYLPACYAQAFCQGLYNVAGYKYSLERDLKLDFGKTFFFSGLDSCSGLGFDHSVTGGDWHETSTAAIGGINEAMRLCVDCLQSLCQTKATVLRENLCNRVTTITYHKVSV